MLPIRAINKRRGEGRCSPFGVLQPAQIKKFFVAPSCLVSQTGQVHPPADFNQRSKDVAMVANRLVLRGRSERSTICYWERPEWIVTASMACHWCHAMARRRGCVASTEGGIMHR